MTSPLSIAIVGAGPAGLTLARLLQVCAAEEKVSLSVSIFEKDASPTSRTFQGGTLDLHPPTGLAAIKACKLWDEFLKYARYEGEELVFADKNATEFIHMKEATQTDNSDARPEIDRERLKTLLLDSVEPSWIKWGKHLRSVTEGGMLNFDDNSSAGPFDLIVGAEGAWSKVARMVTEVRPTYSGIAGLACVISRPNEEHPALSKLVGRGSYFALSDAKAIIAQRMGDETLKVTAWLREDEDYPAKLIGEWGSNEEKLKEKILEHYHDWVPELRQLVEVSTQFQAWPLHELPVDHHWEHINGFTLIGDAAHLMTPFAGEGGKSTYSVDIFLLVLPSKWRPCLLSFRVFRIYANV